MAINFSNSNLSSSSNNVFSIEKFNGVDYTTTPTNVDDSRAIDCSNYLPSGFGLEKRNGYSIIASFTERLKSIDSNVEKVRILNIWKYNGKYVCYVDLSPSNDNKMIFYCDSIESNEPITNVILRGNCNLDYSYAVEFDNRLFILCMEKYLMLNEKMTIVNVSSIAYIPTILSGLGHINSSTVPQYIEDFNMLSNNAYFSVAVDLSSTREYDIVNTFNRNILELMVYDYKEDEYTIEEEYPSSPIILKTSDNGTFGVYMKVEKDAYSGFIKSLIIKPVESSSGEPYNDITITTFLLLLENSKSIDTINKMRFGISYGSYGSKDRLFLAGNPNFKHTDFHSAEASFSDSEWLDYTYFPDTSFQTFGSSDSAIIGYGLLSNGSMAIFKEGKIGTNNLYFREAIITTSVEEYSIQDTYSGEIIKYSYPKAEENFPIKVAGISLDIDSNTKIIQYDNKLIFSNESGIHYISIDISTSTQTYSAYELSYFIRNEISSDTSVSDMIVYKNNLYVLKLSKNGEKRVYVADSNRYSFVSEKLQYEWWVLDGIDTEKFFMIDDKLHFANENGLYRFIEEQYHDYDYINVSDIKINDTSISSEIFIDTERDKIIFDKNSRIFNNLKKTSNLKEAYEEIIKNTYISFGNNYIFNIDNKFDIIEEDISDESNLKIKLVVETMNYSSLFNSIVDNKISVYASKYGSNYYLNECSLEYLYEDDKEYAVLTPKICSFIDDEYNQLSLQIKANEDLQISKLYATHDGNEYCLNEVEYSNGIWYYVGHDNSKFIELGEMNFNIAELEYLNTHVYFDDRIETISNIKISIYKPIHSYWDSKYNALNRLDYLKTANYIYFVPMADKGGFTNIGYRTSKQSSEYYSNEHNSLDFNKIDFGDFTFSQQEFGRTYSSKKKIKNFSFIQIHIYSNEDRNSSISTLAFRYKYTKNNKGVK